MSAFTGPHSIFRFFLSINFRWSSNDLYGFLLFISEIWKLIQINSVWNAYAVDEFFSFSSNFMPSVEKILAAWIENRLPRKTKQFCRYRDYRWIRLSGQTIFVLSISNETTCLNNNSQLNDWFDEILEQKNYFGLNRSNKFQINFPIAVNNVKLCMENSLESIELSIWAAIKLNQLPITKFTNCWMILEVKCFNCMYMFVHTDRFVLQQRSGLVYMAFIALWYSHCFWVRHISLFSPFCSLHR